MILAIYNYIHTLFEFAGPKVVVEDKSRGPLAVSHTSYNVMTSWFTHAPLVFGCLILHTKSVMPTGTSRVAKVHSAYFKECSSGLFCHMVQKWYWYGIGSMQMWCTDTRAWRPRAVYVCSSIYRVSSSRVEWLWFVFVVEV